MKENGEAFFTELNGETAPYPVGGSCDQCPRFVIAVLVARQGRGFDVSPEKVGKLQEQNYSIDATKNIQNMMEIGIKVR